MGGERRGGEERRREGKGGEGRGEEVKNWTPLVTQTHLRRWNQ